MGLLPMQFWSLTFFEYASYSKHLRYEDSRQWWHTSSLLAMTANVNRDPKKTPTPYKPKDFHPYPDQGKKKAKFVRGLTDEEKELTTSWAEKFHQQNG